MEKDFFRWHELKMKIHDSYKAPLFREREIWWCSLGANIGIESDGKNLFFERPVLIFRKFNSEMFWALPLTSTLKSGFFYFEFPLQGKNRSIILSQMRVLSARRLIRRISKVSDHVFLSVENAFSRLIQKTDPFRSPRVPNGNK